MKDMMRNRRAIPIFIILGVALCYIVYDGVTYFTDTPFVVPVLTEQGVGAKWARKKTLMASFVQSIYGTPYYLTRFSANEQPVIKPTQPEDAIAFECPPGTAIAVQNALSTFGNSRDQWVYGLYANEAARVQAGEPASAVFDQTKFHGRATGFGFVNPTGALVVPPNAQANGLFFATADVPSGETVHVRCAIAAPAVCGDWFIDGSEDCDDGNIVGGDGCAADCRTPTAQPQCGNGVVEANEACDDGNTSNTDACLNTCVANVCGDGFVNVGTEQCDDAKTCEGTGTWCSNPSNCAPGKSCTLQNGDGCSGTCTIEMGNVCTLTADKNPPTPERSLCSFLAPGVQGSSSSSTMGAFSSSSGGGGGTIGVAP